MPIGLAIYVAGWALAALAAGAITAIVLAVLHWQRIVTYIREQCSALVNNDTENEAFSFHERLKNGRYQTVYGVLNRRSEKIVQGVKADSAQVDPDVARFHAKEPLVLFQ